VIKNALKSIELNTCKRRGR